MQATTPFSSLRGSTVNAPEQVCCAGWNLLLGSDGRTNVFDPTITPQIFVLVHGAWHGGWCWRRVANALCELDSGCWNCILPTVIWDTVFSLQLPTGAPIATAVRSKTRFDLQWKRRNWPLHAGFQLGSRSEISLPPPYE